MRGLQVKYRELAQRYAELNRRVLEHQTVRISTFRLAQWVLASHQSALSVWKHGLLQQANPRWHALSREQGVEGTWVAEGGEGAPAAGARLEGLWGVARAAVAATAEGAPVRVRRYRRLDGAQALEAHSEWVRWGQDGLVMVLVRDVTRQVEAEEAIRHREAEQREAHRLASLGEMVAGLTHDLHGTLGAVRLRLSLIDEEVEDAKGVQRHVEFLRQVMEDATERLSRLQDFARQRPEALPLEGVPLAEVVEGAAGLVREGHAQQGVFVQLAVPRSLPPVHGSAVELRFVFINLLNNARDAMPHGGTVRVSARQQGPWVHVWVTDEGTGIPPEHLPRIFDPFFTTKGRRGMGLGLAMAYGTLARAGGAIRASNRQGGGACLTLTLPVAAAAAAAGGPEAPSAPPVAPPHPGDAEAAELTVLGRQGAARRGRTPLPTGGSAAVGEVASAASGRDARERQGRPTPMGRQGAGRKGPAPQGEGGKAGGPKGAGRKRRR
jgi:signal transduction histidine kinase